MQEIFDLNNMVTITNSVYLVSVDNNVMAGKIGLVNDQGRSKGLVYLPFSEENAFISDLPEKEVYLIYLSFPNNFIGTILTYKQGTGDE